LANCWGPSFSSRFQILLPTQRHPSASAAEPVFPGGEGNYTHTFGGAGGSVGRHWEVQLFMEHERVTLPLFGASASDKLQQICDK